MKQSRLEDKTHLQGVCDTAHSFKRQKLVNEDTEHGVAVYMQDPSLRHSNLKNLS